MGVENNEIIIATIYRFTRAADNNGVFVDVVDKVKCWVNDLQTDEKSLFAFINSLFNDKVTIILGPDGSKKGESCKKYQINKNLRTKFIELIETFNYSDGSNPFDWVEVGYGEYGQKILRGNCKNRYNDKEYAVDIEKDESEV